MATPLHGREHATRLLLVVLCLFAFGPIMVAALFKIISIEARNGYRALKGLVQTRAYPATPSERGCRDPDDRATTPSG